MDVDLHSSCTNRNPNVCFHTNSDFQNSFESFVPNNVNRSNADLDLSQNDLTRNVQLDRDNPMILDRGVDLTHCNGSGSISNFVLNSIHPQSHTKHNLGDSLVYTAQKHSSNILEIMNILRKNKELCDVVLLVGDHEIFAHRVVMAACSPYFRAMFTNELAESRQNEVHS